MNIIRLFAIGCFTLIFHPQAIIGYSQGGLNLGFSNFLDGGPIRPTPGWYLFAFNEFYHTNTLLDGEGHLLGGVLSPEYNAWGIIVEAAYQGDKNLIPHAALGIDVGVPILLISSINKEPLGITNSGSGFGDLGVSLYMQFDTLVTKHERPLFVHRVSFGANFPTGQDKAPAKRLNPGTRMYSLKPYWAATLFVTDKFSASWRFYYIWNTQDRNTKVKAGDAALLNYSLAYQIIQKLFIGVNGYFLQQLKNDKLCGKEVPNSRERVVGIGPGLVYFFPKELELFAHLYVECDVRNRPKGISFILSFAKHF